MLSYLFKQEEKKIENVFTKAIYFTLKQQLDFMQHLSYLDRYYKPSLKKNPTTG